MFVEYQKGKVVSDKIGVRGNSLGNGLRKADSKNMSKSVQTVITFCGRAITKTPELNI